MIKINLLPHRRVKPADRSLMKVKGLVTLITVLVALAILAALYLTVSEMSDLKKTKEETAAKLADMKKKVVEVQGYEKSRLDYENKLMVIQKLEKSRAMLTPLLVDINRSTNREVWLTSLGVKDNAVSIEAMGIGRDKIDAFFEGLKHSQSLTDLSMSEAKDSPTANRPDIKTYSFTVTAKLAGVTPLSQPSPAAQQPAAGAPAPQKAGAAMPPPAAPKQPAKK